ncbi:MAG TPA: isoprenylcysteine carboxylmethyltransferase family protein [Anaerolineales bacterium]
MKKLTPPTFMFYCLLGMITLRWIFPLGLMSNRVFLVFGVWFIVLGLVAAFGAESQFRRINTTVDHLGVPTKLVTDGWFKHSRNPMYLSLALVLTGAWLALGSISPLLGILVYLFLTERYYIMPEEKRLMTAFGKEYESYQTRTRRWL